MQKKIKRIESPSILNVLVLLSVNMWYYKTKLQKTRFKLRLLVMPGVITFL